MSVAVFTSIPPEISRFDRFGAQIGTEYLRRCIESWRAAGYRVVSLNGADEAATIAAQHPTIEVRALDRTAAEILGRPLPFLADILRECAAEPEAVVGVINADLFLHAPMALAELLGAADDRTLLYGRRFDVEDVDAPVDEEPYEFGFDWFFFAPAMVRELRDEGFVFGECWWDYWFPLVLAARGCRLYPAHPPVVRHLRHAESFFESRAGSYLAYFAVFVRALSQRLPLPGNEPWTAQVSPMLAAMIERYRDADLVRQFCLSQTVAHAVVLYLLQHHAPADVFAARWRQEFEIWDHDDVRLLIEHLIEVAESVGAPAASRRSV
jgi:hypothetical protein